MSVTIRELAEDELGVFADYPFALFSGHPHWVGGLKKDAVRLLATAHPFWRHGERALFMAFRDGSPAGRIAAIVNRAHNSFHGENCGFFGFFDCADDKDAAAALFAAAEKYLRAKGMDKIRGPANPSTNETCGLLIDGFDGPPMIMMPYNPPYYAGLIEAAGFVKAKDLFAYKLAAGGRLEKPARRAMPGDDITVEPADINNFDDAMADLKDIRNSARENNWGFVPMTDAELTGLGADLKHVLKPDHLFFARVEGKAAAFALMLPDLNIPLKAARGSLTPLTFLPFLYRMSFKIRAGRLLALAVKNEFRDRGLESPLIQAAMEAARRMGWEYGEISWTLEDNVPLNTIIETAGGRVYRKYRIYEKTIH